MCAPPLLGWSRYEAEGFLTSCSWDYLTRTASNRAYYVYLLTLGFVVPVGVISFCYTFILAAIYRHGKEMDSVKKNQGNSGYHRGGKTATTSSHQPSTSTSNRQQNAANTSYNRSVHLDFEFFLNSKIAQHHFKTQRHFCLSPESSEYEFWI